MKVGTGHDTDSLDPVDSVGHDTVDTSWNDRDPDEGYGPKDCRLRRVNQQFGLWGGALEKLYELHLCLHRQVVYAAVSYSI